MSKKITYFFIAILFFTSLRAQEAEWISLFNGKDLDGWEQKGGKAEYKVEDGCIVGVSRRHTPNSFMTTQKHYGDFILEYEVLVDPRLNSGVQIRSNSFKDYNNGQVHGYQVEIDPSPRAFSGGIYEEGRRAWLYPLSRNEKGRAAFRNGIWNKFRVEAIGHTIKTWVNGVQCTHLIDDLTSSGFIGLQVHGIGSAEQEGTTVRWRNLRIMVDQLEQHIWTNDPEVPQLSYLVNKLTPFEKRLGWRLLWDGKSHRGWRGATGSHFPEKGWTMENGVLTVLGKKEGAPEGNADIITEDTFSDFELELEFKITKGANSGIKYFVDPELIRKSGTAIGCEFQILDDRQHNSAVNRVNTNQTVASLHDLIAAENLSIPGRGKQFKGVGAWNKARIVSRNGKAEHWLNGEQTVAFDRNSQMFRALVGFSKYRDYEGFGQIPEGHILLQDHGDTVHFRSIKIREF